MSNSERDRDLLELYEVTSRLSVVSISISEWLSALNLLVVQIPCTSGEELETLRNNVKVCIEELEELSGRKEILLREHNQLISRIVESVSAEYGSAPHLIRVENRKISGGYLSWVKSLV